MAWYNPITVQPVIWFSSVISNLRFYKTCILEEQHFLYIMDSPQHRHKTKRGLTKARPCTKIGITDVLMTEESSQYLIRLKSRTF